MAKVSFLLLAATVVAGLGVVDPADEKFKGKAVILDIEESDAHLLASAKRGRIVGDEERAEIEKAPAARRRGGTGDGEA